MKPGSHSRTMAWKNRQVAHCALLVLLCVMAGVATAAIRIVGDNGYVDDPAVSFASSGYGAVVWTRGQYCGNCPLDENAGDGSGTAVYARAINSGGTLATSPFRVNQTLTGHQSHAEVATRADGVFMVAWRSDYATDDSAVYARIFYPNGGAVGPEFRVGDNPSPNEWVIDISVLGDGRFTVFWSDAYAPTSGATQTVFKRVFEADGTPVEAAQPILFTDPPATRGQHYLATDTAIWHGTVTNSLASDLYLTSSDPDSMAHDTTVDIDVGQSGNVSSARIADLGFGRLAVAWERQVSGTNAIYLTLFSDGDAETIDMFVASGTRSNIAVNSLGEIMVSYFHIGTNTIRAKIYDTYGNELVSAFPLSGTARSDYGLAPSVDGDFVAVWSYVESGTSEHYISGNSFTREGSGKWSGGSGISTGSGGGGGGGAFGIELILLLALTLLALHKRREPSTLSTNGVKHTQAAS